MTTWSPITLPLPAHDTSSRTAVDSQRRMGYLRLQARRLMEFSQSNRSEVRHGRRHQASLVMRPGELHPAVVPSGRHHTLSFRGLSCSTEVRRLAAPHKGRIIKSACARPSLDVRTMKGRATKSASMAARETTSEVRPGETAPDRCAHAALEANGSRALLYPPTRSRLGNWTPLRLTFSRLPRLFLVEEPRDNSRQPLVEVVRFSMELGDPSVERSRLIMGASKSEVGL